MATFINTKAKEEGDKEALSGQDEMDEHEECDSDKAFIAPENSPEKSKKISKLEKMDQVLEKQQKKEKRKKEKRQISSSSEEEIQVDNQSNNEEQELEVIIDKPKSSSSKEFASPPKPQKMKKPSIPPISTADDTSEEEDDSSLVTEAIKCPICPNFWNNGYSQKDNKFYLVCKGEACPVSWFDESSAGTYISKIKHNVLKKFKHPQPLVRCHCDSSCKLVWLRFKRPIVLGL